MVDNGQVTPPKETFEERMKARREVEEEAKRLEAERLTADYLKRTGREEMKP